MPKHKPLSLVSAAKDYGLDERKLTNNVNSIYILADLQESFLNDISKELNTIGMDVPKLKQEVYEAKKALRALVGTVNQVCAPENVEKFGEQSDQLKDMIYLFLKDDAD